MSLEALITGSVLCLRAVMNLFLVTKYVYRFLKKRYVAHKVHQLLFRARFLYNEIQYV